MIIWKNVVLSEKEELPVRHRETRIGRGLEKTHKPCYDKVQKRLRTEKRVC